MILIREDGDYSKKRKKEIVQIIRFQLHRITKLKKQSAVKPTKKHISALRNGVWLTAKLKFVPQNRYYIITLRAENRHGIDKSFEDWLLEKMQKRRCLTVAALER